MNLNLEDLSLLDITVGLRNCGSEKNYWNRLLQYLKEEKWGEVQAYSEIKDWKRYYETVKSLESNSRIIGAMQLAEDIRQLVVAAEEKNGYYIEHHQAEVMSAYQKLLEQLEEVLGEKKEEQRVSEKSSAHILVVDDEEENLREVEKNLSGYFRVSLAKSGEEAFRMMEKIVPDLVLVDVYMPEMDGFEWMELLQKDDKWKNIPVIFLTTDHNQEIEVRGFKAGAQDFITKPFVADIMIQRVSRILELSRLQKNLRKEVDKQTRKAEERRRQVERLSDQIINALAEAIDAKDTYTNGHSLRVARYSVKIAKRAGKSEKEQERIYYMGMLHDIGKIGIPDSIITKDSNLSDKEYFVTRKHPEIGAEILATISAIPDLGVGARWHHERYDGTGYPDGLKGTDIPEEARLIAVADAYDAMASKRSYRDVLPQEVVYEEIKNGKGTQFDPVFADIMLSLMDEDKEYKMREK